MLKWKYGLWQIESTMLMCEDKLTANQIDDQENCVLDIKCQKIKELITNRIHGTDQVDDKGSNWIPFVSYIFSSIFVWW